MSHALEMKIHFYYPTLQLFCFSFTQPFTYSKFCLYPTLFSSVPPPAMKNDQSLRNGSLSQIILVLNLRHWLFLLALQFTVAICNSPLRAFTSLKPLASTALISAGGNVSQILTIRSKCVDDFLRNFHSRKISSSCKF